MLRLPNPAGTSIPASPQTPKGRGRNGGFTLIEVTVALFLMTTVLLGLAASAGSLSTVNSQLELRAVALHAAENRIELMRIDPNYADLNSMYSGVEDSLFGLPPNFQRRTVVNRINQPQTGGGVLDYYNVMVEISGPALATPVRRTATIAAP